MENTNSLLDVLLKIYHGETNAIHRYKIFGEASQNKAVQKCFLTTSLAEKIHSEKMRKAALRSGFDMSLFTPDLQSVAAADDIENLKIGIKGEIYESTILYPELAKIADSQKNQFVSSAVNLLGKVEAGHAKLFQDAIDNLVGKDIEVTYYLCPLCGHIMRDEYPDKCEMCGGSNKMFQKY